MAEHEPNASGSAGKPAEGFVHKGRRVFALRYRLECEPPQITELIVPLGPDGNATSNTVPADASKCMVNVKPGESLVHCGQEYKVLAVEVFRSLPLME